MPSVSLLMAFEAVVRSGSTANAARELDLSQGAVSKLVQNLESQLGVQLFERYRQRLLPTEAAKAYCRDVTQALDVVQRASTQLVTNPGGGTFALAILPAFGTRWLAPRLGGFQRANPGVTVNLSTRLRRFSFTSENFDAAIHFGADDWVDAGHLKLFEERITACAAKSLIDGRAVQTAEDVLGLPLLQLETRPQAWPAWFAGQDSAPQPTRGMLFDQFAPMMQAAISGLGVALLPDYLAAPEIEEARLVPLLRPSIRSGGSYWLVWPKAKEAYPPLRAFRHWIVNHETSAD